MTIQEHFSTRSSPGPSVRTMIPLKLENGTEPLIASFDNLSDGREHVALIFGDGARQDAPLVRVHSECLTGDVFHARRCDCGSQLQEAIDRLSAGGGILLYLRQEGRGIGLYNKLDAYKLQIEEGLDTYEANRAIGQVDDARDYRVAADMLKALDVARIRLLTSNPDKRAQLERHGVSVVACERTGSHVRPDNRCYLEAKKSRGHCLELGD